MAKTKKPTKTVKTPKTPLPALPTKADKSPEELQSQADAADVGISLGAVDSLLVSSKMKPGDLDSSEGDDNLTRARKVMNALELNGDLNEEAETVFSDFIGNAMHFARLAGLNWETVMRRATSHYDFEKPE